MNHPGAKMNFRELFPDMLRSLKRDFYVRRGATIEQVQKDLAKVGTPDYDKLPQDRREQVELTLENMESRYGYCHDCALEMIAYALKKVPAEELS